jgi:hypothetical protein
MAKTTARRRGGASKGARKAAKSAKSARAGAASRKRAAKKARPKAGSRKSTAGSRKAARPSAKRAKKAAARAGTTRRRKAAARPAAGRVRKTATARTGSGARTKKATAAAATPTRRAPTLDRPRRSVGEVEMVPSPPSSLNMNRSASAARSGRAELNDKLHEHTSSSPILTAGDVDADWEAAESVGDEAPGGDNPTPDQDVVDEIGKALGVEYDDDEELRGGDEIVERDKKRWELDPASRDDFDDRDD